jgi:hypothetical protein
MIVMILSSFSQWPSRPIKKRLYPWFFSYENEVYVAVETVISNEEGTVLLEFSNKMRIGYDRDDLIKLLPMTVKANQEEIIPLVFSYENKIYVAVGRLSEEGKTIVFGQRMPESDEAFILRLIQKTQENK